MDYNVRYAVQNACELAVVQADLGEFVDSYQFGKYGALVLPHSTIECKIRTYEISPLVDTYFSRVELRGYKKAVGVLSSAEANKLVLDVGPALVLIKQTHPFSVGGRFTFDTSKPLQLVYSDQFELCVQDGEERCVESYFNATTF